HKIHARNDVLLVARTGVTLLQRVGRDETGLFEDVTESAGLAGIGAGRVVWVDYEHDGDLDLALARETGLELWQNNGDGRFQNVTEQVGIQASGTFLDVAAIDLDNDVAVDLIAARGEAPTMVFENQRAGRMARMPEPPGPWPAATRVLVNDLNNDSYADVVLLNPTTVVVLLGRKEHRPHIDLGAVLPADAKLVDYDNDGWLDLCVVGTNRGDVDQGAVQLWRNVAGDRSGIPKWVNVSKETGLAGIVLPPIKEVIPLDIDADGDTDLLLLTADSQLRVLRNEGGHANGQLKIRLATIKTNASGIGTHIELRDRGRFITRTVTRLPIEIGLGGLKHLDSLQTLWTNGVVQNQIDAELTATPLTILEKNVATGSCPFLYAWDGRQFRFVTDLLGNSPIGLPLTRNVLLPADPDEIVRIGDAENFPSRDGAYVLKITDEFREVLYLDQVKLLAVDHPLDIEVHPTDKLMPEPFPPSEVWRLGSPRRLVRAMGDDGIDRTEALRAIDGVFAPPGVPLPPPFRGMCHPMTLTMDFGEIDPTQPLVLALTGWLQYGDASTNIALSQSSTLRIIPPALEAQSSTGKWSPVEGIVGMPAGKTKTILMDLNGRLPQGVRRLRLTTTFEIRWDRIALFERAAPDAQQTHELLPTGADLQWRGFSELISRGPGHPTTPDHDNVADRPAWRTAQEGWCTRYGDVLELILRRDDRLAILNAGDALTLRFDATTLGPVPPGFARTFFLYSVGWDKDGDLNVTTGLTVAPLPRNDPNQSLLMSSPHDDWDHRYNTRWVPRDRFTPAR
ncbi:MAG: VCBS repeat-containing protein, partial [Planctomycetes bacterium]|nr:VCBS repeat-containing protein [Planctomycetota bacterium]